MIAYVVIFSILAVLLVASALYAVIQKDLLIAVISTGVISLILSVFFYLMQAPDVGNWYCINYNYFCNYHKEYLAKRRRNSR